MDLAGYIRVSQEDEEPENQEHAIYRWAASRGHRIVELCSDVGVSGAVPPTERPGFAKCLSLLEAGKASGMVVAALDRVARSLWELASVYKTFREWGWTIYSVREEWLTEVDPRVRDFLVAVLGWAGEMEREYIRERTREALARLRAQGKRVGRPRVFDLSVRYKIVELVRRGLTLREACKLVEVNYSTARKHLAGDPEYLDAKKEAQLARRRERERRKKEKHAD